ncbi:MAG: outer membrane protein assembly factor BamE [Pseudomonadota bacterium]
MRALILIFIASLALAGCKSMPSFSMPSLTPYKIDIQQGNYVDSTNVDKLRIGMTRAQISFIMGTPLVKDMFHTNRWDYVYIDKKAGKLITKRRVAVYFDGDVAKRIVEVKNDGKEVDINTALTTDETVPADANAPAVAAPVPDAATTPAEPAAGGK